MATNEDRYEHRPASLKTITLSILLPVLLAYVALLGFGGAAGIVNGLLAMNMFSGPWAWKTKLLLAQNLLMFVGGIGGLLWLKPWEMWKGSDEPDSPGTRRTKKLFALSGLIGVPGTVALIYGTLSKDDPFALLSGSPISLGIALIAVLSWLLSNAVAWWWYVSADEHERRANDFGFLLGGGLILALTPAWWVLARAGLLPQPDAMLLWLVFVVAMTIGWFWHRNR